MKKEKAVPPAPTPPKTAQDTPAKAPAKRKRWLKGVFLGVVTLVILILAAATTYAFYYSDRYLPHTTVAGVNISGMKQADAEALIEKKEDAFLASTITVTHGSKSWQVKVADMHTSFATGATLTALWQEEKGDTTRSQLHQLALAPFRTHAVDVGMTVATAAGEKTLQTNVFDQAETPYQETSLSFDQLPVVVVPGVAGSVVNTALFNSAFYNVFAGKNQAVSLQFSQASPQVTSDQAAVAATQANTLLASSLTVQLGTTGKTMTVAPATIEKWLTATVSTAGGTPSLALAVDKTAMAATLTTWAQTVNIPAVNAQLQHDSSGVVSVVTPDQPGQTLDQDGTVTALTDWAESAVPTTTLTIPVTTAPAAVRADNYTSLGLVNLIGTDTTNFSGSPKDRVTNIDQGQKLLNGILVAPGATFSTIKNLGDIDSAHGFVPELVILNGTQLVDQDGGGLCQVSTTLFRSTLNAGLNIVERQNHSFRVGYYEVGTGPGLDATIYDPQPDFQWQNDTAQNIYVESSVSGSNLTFDLYGTSDGRVATIGKPDILSTSTPGPPQYADTPSLPTGKTEELIGPVDGAKVTVTYQVTRNGQQLENRTFVSNYIPEPAQIEVGTGPAA